MPLLHMPCSDKKNLCCRRWDVVNWLQAQQPSAYLQPELCAAVATADNPAALEWLQLQNGPFSMEGAALAFQEGHLQTLSWLAQKSLHAWPGLDSIYLPEISDALGDLKLAAPSTKGNFLGRAFTLDHVPLPWCNHDDQTVLALVAQALLERSSARARRLNTLWIDSAINELLSTLGTAQETLHDASVMLTHAGFPKALASFQPQRKPCPPHDVDPISLAARSGNLVMLQFWLTVHSTTKCVPRPLPKLQKARLTDALFKEAITSGNVDMLMWMSKQVRFHPWTSACCLEAAKSGQLKALEWLRSLQPPCPWSLKHIVEALCVMSEADIVQLRAQEPALFTEDLCSKAAAHRQLGLLKTLRRLRPPCPWDERVFNAGASCGYILLCKWASGQGCPVNLEDARKFAPILAASGQLQVLQQIWPFKVDIRKLLHEAAKHGQPEVLSWLLDQQPGISPQPRVIQAAAENGHLQMLRSLLTRQPPAEMPHRVPNVHGLCLMTLAKAGCPMATEDRERVQPVVRLQCTIVGLVRWASRIDLPLILETQSPKELSSCGGKELLAQLTRLPIVLLECVLDQVLCSISAAPSCKRGAEPHGAERNVRQKSQHAKYSVSSS